MRLTSWFDRDVRQGLVYGSLVAAAVLAVVLPLNPASGPTTPGHVFSPTQATEAAVALQPVVPREVDFAGQPATAAARRLARWVVTTADHGTRPFVVLDKKDARAFVFAANGRLVGASPVLLGYARGDDSVVGIGDRPIAQVRPSERTTPAGRFVSLPGRNARGEDVLWVDYDAAVSMHRVLLNNPAERRAQRLASPSAADNRISYGCINVPVRFFEQTLWPSMRGGSGIIYVLPEDKRLEAVFPSVPRMTSATG